MICKIFKGGGARSYWAQPKGGPTLKAKIKFSIIRLIFICPFTVGHCEQNNSFHIFEILLFSLIFWSEYVTVNSNL